MLYEINQPKVKLSNEIECVYSLIDLFQLKFDEKLNIKVNCSSIDPSLTIVPNLFTPLVENAFKHGDFGRNPAAFLTIEINAKNTFIFFKITNSFSQEKKESTQPGGIGLTNLKRRFQINYEPSGRLKFTTKANQFSAAMIIPIIN